MKVWRTYTVILLVISFSCNSDNDTVFSSEFDESLSVFSNTKNQFNNTYQFTLSTRSVFGFGTDTSMRVLEGIVIERAYRAYTINSATGEKEIIANWVENEASLNSHEEGAAAMTIDQIYSSCNKDILSVSPDTNFIDFEASNDGIISLCTYFPKNCADDCSVGFIISSFTWGS